MNQTRFLRWASITKRLSIREVTSRATCVDNTICRSIVRLNTGRKRDGREGGREGGKEGKDLT